jgi:hypothetical protein
MTKPVDSISISQGSVSDVTVSNVLNTEHEVDLIPRTLNT